jgi:hypothetical protein
MAEDTDQLMEAMKQRELERICWLGGLLLLLFHLGPHPIV